MIETSPSAQPFRMHRKQGLRNRSRSAIRRDGARTNRRSMPQDGVCRSSEALSAFAPWQSAFGKSNTARLQPGCIGPPTPTSTSPPRIRNSTPENGSNPSSCPSWPCPSCAGSISTFWPSSGSFGQNAPARRMRISAHLLLVLRRIFLLLIGLASSLDATAARAGGWV